LKPYQPSPEALEDIGAQVDAWAAEQRLIA
jgi:hypothetical protein